jgi:2-polyprenyl-3-methyl-5-hydroxy-6-metoxy-1,4-benzoquinol methylase
MAKLAYLRRSLATQLSPTRFNCPNCGSVRNSVTDRKFVITQLRRCDACRMLFRTPTDDPAANATFYETEYAQGFTTDLPSDEALTELKRTSFGGTEKSYSYYIGVLSALGLKPRNKVFDFGCSWGYGSYQFEQAGFEVTSFEVATTRRRYAKEKLGVSTVDDMDRVAADHAQSFDCFFSAHVLEHVPSPARAFDYGMRLLKPGGLFVSFTPNGSDQHRAASSQWSKLWGEVHPTFIEDVFLDHSFSQLPRAVGSSPVESPSLPQQAELRKLDDLSRTELFFVARKVENV